MDRRGGISGGADEREAARVKRLLDGVISGGMAVRGPGEDAMEAREELLAEVAKLVISVDPDRAESFARSVGDRHRLTVLATMAARLAGVDPSRADRLFADVERTPLWSPRTAVGVAEMAKAVTTTDRRRAKRLLEAVVRCDFGYHSFRRGTALADLAAAVADADQGRAKALLIATVARGQAMDNVYGQGLLQLAALAMASLDIRRAERIAGSMVHPSMKPAALAGVARAMAATDPNHAEGIARRFTDVSRRVQLMADIAVAGKDRNRAKRLIEEAEELATTIMDGRAYMVALTSVIKAMAVYDPGRAVRRAEAIAQETGSPWALTAVAPAIAAAHPDRAEHIAQSITGQSDRLAALADTARAVAAVEPDRAERITGLLPDSYHGRQQALADVAKTMAIADSPRAERLAHSITDGYYKAAALVEVIKQLKHNP